MQKHQFDLSFNLKHFQFKGDTSSVKKTIIKVGGWKESVTYIVN